MIHSNVELRTVSSCSAENHVDILRAICNVLASTECIRESSQLKESMLSFMTNSTLSVAKSLKVWHRVFQLRAHETNCKWQLRFFTFVDCDYALRHNKCSSKAVALKF